MKVSEFLARKEEFIGRDCRQAIDGVYLRGPIESIETLTTGGKSVISIDLQWMAAMEDSSGIWKDDAPTQGGGYGFNTEQVRIKDLPDGTIRLSTGQLVVEILPKGENLSRSEVQIPKSLRMAELRRVARNS